jgi:hypothetical protein
MREKPDMRRRELLISLTGMTMAACSTPDLASWDVERRLMGDVPPDQQGGGDWQFWSEQAVRHNVVIGTALALSISMDTRGVRAR